MTENMPGIRLAVAGSAFIGGAIVFLVVGNACFLALFVHYLKLRRRTPPSERWFGWPLKDRLFRWLLAVDILCCTAAAGLIVFAAMSGAFGEWQAG